MGLDFHTELLQMLDNGTIDGTAKIGVLISNSSRFVADLIEYVLTRPRMLLCFDPEEMHIPGCHLPLKIGSLT